MTESKATFCRICEPSCGLIAEVSGGEVLRLRPDKKHPVTRGFACHKGIGFTRIHTDPDRVNYPQKRSGNTHTTVSWDQALDEVAEMISGLIQKHGPEAVAVYSGNPLAFSASAPAAIGQFQKALGIRRQFNAGTQDCSNKFAGAEAVFGTSTLHPVPDLERTEFALILGENPAVSHMSFVSQADPVGAFRRLRKRGAKVRFVNPRRIESVASDEELVQLTPDTDLYLLAALLHEIDQAGLFAEAVLAAHGRHVNELRAFIAPYDAETVGPVCGLEPALIRQLALDFAKADSACVHMSTGVNMGRQGTLCYWLVQMLSFCTGNLDRAGGNLYGVGFFPATRSGRIDLTGDVYEGSPHGDVRTIRGALPGNLLADYIESDPSPIRALIVVAGNPLLSVGGEERLRQAFAKLDLLVSVDLYRNATGELANYVLPACDMLERADLNMCGLGMQAEPFVQFADAVVPPRGERREEWWIFGELLARIKGSEKPKAEHVLGRLDHMLSASGLDRKQLLAAPSGTAALPAPATGKFYEQWIQTPDKKVDCCPAFFAEALVDAHRLFVEESQRGSTALKLINLRTAYMHNSWLHNDLALKRPQHQDNPLHMHPDDARSRGLDDGDVLKVHNDNGAIRARLQLNESLRPGVVAMEHGWGQQQSSGMQTAQRFPGVNVNRLLPHGQGSYEKLSNQAHMTGIEVVVDRVA